MIKSTGSNCRSINVPFIYANMYLIKNNLRLKVYNYAYRYLS